MKKRVSIIFLLAMILVTACSCPVCAADYDDYFWYDDYDDYDDEECEHDWETEVIQKATPFHRGIIEKTCYDCDETKIIYKPKKKMTAREKKSVKTVRDFFKAAKKYDLEKMQKYLVNGSKKLADRDSCIGEISRKYNKKYLKCKVTDVRTKGSKVYVEVDVDYPDGMKAFIKAFELMEADVLQHIWTNPNYTIPAESVVKYIRQSVSRYGVKTSNIIKEFKVAKIKGKYKIEGFDRKKENINILNCNYNGAWENYQGRYY
ncbi:hypothetical protein AALA00_11460 [Lachnospiraceae bacterium 46-15]